MALKTYEYKTATGDAATSYSFTFPYFNKSEVEVSVDNVIQTQTTKYTFPTATSIKFTTGNIPAVNASIKIYRTTDIENLKAIFAAGSSIRATDLNNNFDLVLAGSQDKIVTNNILKQAVTSDRLDTNIDIEGTFDVTGATTLDSTLNTKGNADFDQNVNVDGTLDVNLATDLSSTLNVDGAATFQDNVTINADNKTFTIENQAGADKFTVDTDNGNTAIAGTLDVTGNSTFSAGLTGTGTTTLTTVDINGGAIDGTTVGASTPAAGTFTTGTFTTGNITTANIDGGAIDGTVIGGNSPAAGSFTTINASGTITGNLTGDLTGKASHLADAASVTSSEQLGSTANDTTYYTTAASDARYYNIGSTEEIVSSEAWVSDDASIATTKAVDNRVVNLVDEVGGFVPIVDETDFPATNPDIKSDGGTIVSVGTLTTSYTPSAGTVTIPASTLDNLSNDLTITGCGATVLAAGYGVLVETKALTDVQYAANPSYTFHRLTPKSSEVTTVAGIAGNVTTVANISSDVTAVAGKETEIGRLGTADAVADLAILGTADVVSDMNTLATADVVSDMNTLATSDIVSDMDTVAGISSNVTTVAGISGNVTTVAGMSANITTVADKASEVTSVAGKITEVETVADNLTAVENFNDTYQIHSFSPSAPTTDGGGVDALVEGDLAYDTTNDKLKVWTGSAWETGVEGHTNLMARAGGTFTGDVTWDNSTNAGKDMFWDESDDTLKFNDDVQISLGSDRDVRLYHTGTHGYINVVTGDLNIRTNGTESAIIAKKDAGVELYYDNSQKVTTTSDGINVTGTTTDDGADHAGDVIFQGDGANSYWDKSNDSLIFNDNAGVNLGTGRDVRFYFDGNHTYLNVVDGNLNIRTNGTENAIICTKDAGVAAYYDNTKKFETTNTGVDVTGNVVVSGTVDGRDLQTDGTKLDGIEASAKDDQTGAEIKAAYEGESDTNAFTDDDHSKLDGIAANANAYVHPTGAGNNHIPTGGASGQFLKYDSSGTAVWAADNDTTYSVGDGGLTQNNFTNTLKSKLDGIADSANAYVHPNHSGEVTSTADGATVIASDVVDEDNLKVDNSPTNDYVLTAKSSAAGGLTWKAAASGTPEGTAILSTGESGGTKYLREDGDGTCSWQTVSGGSDTTYTHTWEDSSDNAILRLTAGGSGSGNDDLTIIAGSNITLTPSGDNLTIAATDTNTQRGIDDTPVDGQTAESISSNWAYDHNAGTGNEKHVPAAGSSGQFLKHDGTWGTPPDTTTPADDSVTGAKLNISLVQGDVIYSSGTDTLARLPKGTAGQALIMNSGATAPEWGAAGATIANDANNRVITADGSAGLNGEANFTFDGSTLALTGNQTATLAVQAQGFECPAEVTANWTIAAANNAMFPGPMTVGNSATVTVPTNRTLTVV